MESTPNVSVTEMATDYSMSHGRKTEDEIWRYGESAGMKMRSGEACAIFATENERTGTRTTKPPNHGSFPLKVAAIA